MPFINILLLNRRAIDRSKPCWCLLIKTLINRLNRCDPSEKGSPTSELLPKAIILPILCLIRRFLTVESITVFLPACHCETDDFWVESLRILSILFILCYESVASLVTFCLFYLIVLYEVCFKMCHKFIKPCRYSDSIEGRETEQKKTRSTTILEATFLEFMEQSWSFFDMEAVGIVFGDENWV
jgi:hypothetical protein